MHLLHISALKVSGLKVSGQMVIEYSDIPLIQVGLKQLLVNLTAL